MNKHRNRSKPIPMEKKITITILEPTIITEPPQPGQMKLDINGLISTEVILILISAASQIASKDLPPLTELIKKTNKEINPMGQIPGKA